MISWILNILALWKSMNKYIVSLVNLSSRLQLPWTHLVGTEYAHSIIHMPDVK